MTSPARQDPLGTLGAGHWAPVPLAGWSDADPLKNLEYWQLDPGDGQAGIQRISAAGELLNSYAFSEDFSPDRLDYDSVHNRMFASGGRTSGNFTTDVDRFAFSLPPSGAPNNTVIPVLRTPIPHPCANPEYVVSSHPLGAPPLTTNLPPILPPTSGL